jgi:DNA repair exonuclease SbcCD ATPase subunit
MKQEREVQNNRFTRSDKLFVILERNLALPRRICPSGQTLCEFKEESYHAESQQERFITFVSPLALNFYDFLLITLTCDFSEFEDLLRSYPASKIMNYQKDYALKSSMLGRIASERLIEQEKTTEKLSQESKKLRRNSDLAQATNLDLEKKVAELAEALRQCQDGKKITEEALEQSRKDFEKLQKTHDDDLSLIENLRKDHDKSSKAAEDLRHNNANLAKTLRGKEQKIQDLKRALDDQKEASGKDISEMEKVYITPSSMGVGLHNLYHPLIYGGWIT